MACARRRTKALISLLTGYEWPVTPDSLYWGARFLWERYQKPIYITENGAAFTDVVENDRVHDSLRVMYLDAYLTAAQRAQVAFQRPHLEIEGVRVAGAMRLLQAHGEVEAAPAPRFALDPYLTLMRRNDFPANRQPQAAAAILRIAAPEAIEDVRQLIGRDAIAGVADLQDDARLVGPQRSGNDAARRRVAQRWILRRAA